jgi:hypothetical protein
MPDQTETLRMAAEIADKFSAPLKKMIAEVQQFQKMVKGTHVEGQGRGSFATGTRSES